MEQKGHIAKVDEPTDWVSSVVYVKKRKANYMFAWILENWTSMSKYQSSAFQLLMM